MKKTIGCCMLGLSLVGIGITTQVHAEELTYIPIYRVYNPNSGEHFYTKSLDEMTHLTAVGWNSEGLAWYAKESGYPLLTEDKAIQILKDDFTSKNQSLDDLSFVPIKQLGQNYLIRLVVLSMVEQGGSGTAGFYLVSPQGLVQACDANGNPY